MESRMLNAAAAAIRGKNAKRQLSMIIDERRIDLAALLQLGFTWKAITAIISECEGMDIDATRLRNSYNKRLPTLGLSGVDAQRGIADAVRQIEEMAGGSLTVKTRKKPGEGAEMREMAAATLSDVANEFDLALGGNGRKGQ